MVNLRAKKMEKMSDFDELYPFGFGENLIFQSKPSQRLPLGSSLLLRVYHRSQKNGEEREYELL